MSDRVSVEEHLGRLVPVSEKDFCESGEGVKLPRERTDLREVRGTSGEVWETSVQPLVAVRVTTS